MVVGCGGPNQPPPTCDPRAFIGDRAQPIEAVLIVTDGVSGAAVDVADGDPAPLIRPPQGGQVTYAAARVRNLSPCDVFFAGRYRDPQSGSELGFDGRNSVLVVGSDGWGRPDPTQLSSFANIAPCPDYDPTRDVVGTPAVLEMTVTDRTSGKKAVVTRQVVPTCTAADARARALCQCECSHLPAGTTRMCAAP